MPADSRVRRARRAYRGRPGRGGCAPRVGGQRRRESGARCPEPSSRRAQQRVGRTDGSRLRRPQRDCRVSGHRRSRRARRARVVGAPAVADLGCATGSPTSRRRADPTDYVGRPIQIFAANYMLVTTSSHASWVFRRGSPAAPADPTGWKPVQLVPENARAGRGGLPVVDPAEREPGHLDRDLRRSGPARRVATRGTIELRVDGARRTVPIELEVYDFVLPDENSMHAMLYYSSDQAELYHGRNLDRRLSPARPSSSRRAGPRVRRADDADRVGPILGHRLHPRSRVRGPRRRRRQCHRRRARSTARAATSTIAPAPGRESDSWMTFVAREAAAGDHVPLRAGRAAPARVSAHRDARREHSLEPGTGPGAADLRDQHVRRAARCRDRHLVLGPEGLHPRSRRHASGRAAVDTGSTTAAGPPAARSRSTLQRPMRGPRSGRPSSTTCASISTGTRCTGVTTRRSRGSATRTCGPTRSPSTTASRPTDRRTTRATFTATAC